MIVTSDEQLLKLKDIGQIVADTLIYMARSMRVGMTTAELDKVGSSYLHQKGAKSAPIEFYDFPGHTCISVNHAAAHGIPNSTVLKAGDLINIDVSAIKDGYVGDTGASFIVGEGGASLGSKHQLFKSLMESARMALEQAIVQAKAGQKINLIGSAIEGVAKKAGWTTIRNLGSHGIGTTLHEEPKFIPGYSDFDDTRVLKKGQVITIEPFVSNGCEWVEELEDGWTLVNSAGGYSAQFEHSMVITDGEPIILTLPSSGLPHRV